LIDLYFLYIWFSELTFREFRTFSSFWFMNFIYSYFLQRSFVLPSLSSFPIIFSKKKQPTTNKQPNYQQPTAKKQQANNLQPKINPNHLPTTKKQQKTANKHQQTNNNQQQPTIWQLHPTTNKQQTFNKSSNLQTFKPSTFKLQLQISISNFKLLTPNFKLQLQTSNFKRNYKIQLENFKFQTSHFFKLHSNFKLQS